jgi:hypothetical protein
VSSWKCVAKRQKAWIFDAIYLLSFCKKIRTTTMQHKEFRTYSDMAQAKPKPSYVDVPVKKLDLWWQDPSEVPAKYLVQARQLLSENPCSQTGRNAFSKIENHTEWPSLEVWLQFRASQPWRLTLPSIDYHQHRLYREWNQTPESLLLYREQSIQLGP